MIVVVANIEEPRALGRAYADSQARERSNPGPEACDANSSQAKQHASLTR
jgi:hypothetical protein